MQKVVGLISVVIGMAFFVLATMFPYGTIIFEYSVERLVNPNRAKARAAVSRLLFDPKSAQFDVLRDVEAEGAQYVCGNVKAKDRGGSYSGRRPFVYEVKIDAARIDDDEQIARTHAVYWPCPEYRKPPPALDLEMAKKVLKVIPKADPQVLSTLDSQLSLPNGSKATPGGGPQAGNMSGQLTELKAKTARSGVLLVADLKNEREWRSDHPPAAWPAFSSDDPLAEPARKRTPEQAIALASDVERRWKSFKAGRSASHPRTGDIEEALGALLAIEPDSKDYPKAWALFVSLRQIDREAAAIEARHKPAIRSTRPRG
jgi:hypothetical protein